MSNLTVPTEDFILQLKRHIGSMIIDENSALVAMNCLLTFERILINCADYPLEPRYRNIKAKGKTMSMILDAKGGLELLKFFCTCKVVEFEQYLVFPSHDRVLDIKILEAKRIVKEYIAMLRAKLKPLDNDKETKRLEKQLILAKIQDDRDRQREKQERTRRTRNKFTQIESIQ
jgi:hypothetical protein